MTTIGVNATSYFSAPSDTLDPKLFQGRALKPQIRSGINTLITDFLGKYYRHSDTWAHPWLAGSGVSFQWSANRQPGDLDCLIGINYIQFRKANPEYAGLSDKEISSQLNEQFHDDLQPGTENWNGYELTFYALVSDDIRSIRPYAAYDLKYDEWTVTPDPAAQPPKNSSWDSVVNGDAGLTQQITTRFNAAMNDMQISQGGAAHRNAEARLTNAAQQGEALFNEIHNNRSQAFSPAGEGYGDFHNYRWQAGKRNGTISSLRALREYVRKNANAENASVYGVDLPDSSTLIRRAATYRTTGVNS